MKIIANKETASILRVENPVGTLVFDLGPDGKLVTGPGWQGDEHAANFLAEFGGWNAHVQRLEAELSEARMTHIAQLGQAAERYDALHGVAMGLAEAAHLLACEAHQNMRGGRGHLIDGLERALADLKGVAE